MLEIREILLRCIVCRREKTFNLTLAQKRQLSEGGRLQFQCSYCACPQHWEAVDSVQITSRGTSGATQQKAILVVDDDELTVRLLRKVLEAWDAKVEVAQNGKEALTKLSVGSFDLLVCDIRMPEMTGQEFIDYLPRQE